MAQGSKGMLYEFRLERTDKTSRSRWYPGGSISAGEEVTFNALRVGDSSRITIVRPNIPIGKGSYGIIYACNIFSEKERVYKKAVVKITKFPFADTPSSFKNELLAHWVFSTYPTCSDYIVCMYGSFKSTMELPGVYDTTGSREQKYFYCIVMERMDGDLSEFCKLVKQHVPDAEQRKRYLMFAAKQMATAILNIHGEGFFHNDVKPSNFLFKWAGDRYMIKVSDMGLVCTMDKDRAVSRIMQSLDREYGMKTVLHDVVSEIVHEGAVLNCTLAGTVKFMTKEKQIAQKTFGRVVPGMERMFAENDVYGIRQSVNYMAVMMDINSSEEGPIRDMTDCNREFNLSDSALRRDIARLEDAYGDIDRTKFYEPLESPSSSVAGTESETEKATSSAS